MSITAERLSAALLAAGLLAVPHPEPAAAQTGTRLPVVFPGDPRPGPGGLLRRPPADGRGLGHLPLDPDDRGIVPRRRRTARPHRHRPLHTVTAFVLPSFGHVAPPAAPRRPAPDGTAGSAEAGDGGEDPPAESAGGRGDVAGDRARSRPEGPCVEAAVRMKGGGVHRLRIDGAALGAETPAEAERELRDRMAARGALVVDGLDGVGLHLAADRVQGVEATACPTLRIP